MEKHKTPLKRTKLKPGKPLKAKTALKRTGFKRKAAAKFIRCVRCENLKPKFGKDDNGLPVCSSCAGPDIVSTAPKRKKPKRRKKTALQKRIDKIDSQYWDKRCAEAVRAWAHQQPCFVCNVMEEQLGQYQYIVGHHLIPRRNSRFFRWDPDNILPLGPKHHKNHKGTLAAHSDDGLTVQAFNDLLKDWRPELYDKWQKREKYLREQNLCDGQKDRPDWKAQHAYWASKLDKDN